MTRSKAASKSGPRRAVSMMFSVFSVMGAGCAGQEAAQRQQPITENLAPAVASPATEAIPMPDRDSTGYYSDVADIREPGVTAPLNESPTPDYDPTAGRKPREIRHTFTPKVSRTGEGVATITAVPVTIEEVTPVAETGLSDGQIVRIAQTIQDAELAEASIVAERAQSERVKQLASQLKADHRSFKENTNALAKSEGLTPVESPVSADMRVKASQDLTAVELARPEEFDRAFIDTQVQQNEQLLQLLDSRLIPDASEPKLKAELTESRDALVRQGEEAKEIQRVLQNAPGSEP